MITVLSIKIPEKKKGVRALSDRLRRDRVEVKTLRAQDVTLRHVTYTGYSGKVKLEKLDEAIGLQRDRLLCSDKLLFPPHSGYRRFSSGAFRARLCENFALGVLDRCLNAPSLHAAIVDPQAAAVPLLPELLARCGEVTVVTDCAQPYACAARDALEELGAAPLITRRRESLADCDLIVAPQPLTEALPSTGAALLTVCPPQKPVGGRVYWRYRFQTPDEYAAIKPAELSEEYFCAALYTLGAQHRLGAILPFSAEGSAAAVSPDALAKQLGR